MEMTLRLIAVIVIALEGAAVASPSAETLFDQGQIAFANGDYETALAKWNESYELSKEPELLFNIAQALRHEGRCAEALATYRRFIMAVPHSEQRTLANEFVLELAAICSETSASKHGATSEPSFEHSPDRDSINEHHPAKLEIAGLVIVGAGVVSVATSLYFGHRASVLDEEVSNACPGADCNWAVLGSKDAEGRRSETKQYVFVGIGASAILGGGVMYWLAGRERQPAPIAITPVRSGAAVTWSGSW